MRGGFVSRRPRRGVLLLVVLSLLALFALIGIAFIIVGTNAKLAARGDARAEQYGDDPGAQIHEVFEQIVRGPAEPPAGSTSRSVLWHQSLLEDLYGLDGVKFSYVSTDSLVGPRALTADNTIAGGQFVDLRFDVDTGRVVAPQTVNELSTTGVRLTGPQQTQIRVPGYFNGCVLTMLDGARKNTSARIVGWGFAANEYTIRVMLPDGVSNDFSGTSAILINGRPFNGTGLGFNFNKTAAAAATDPTLLDLPDTNNIPMAHLPNLKFAMVTGEPNSTTGGMDEPYDAADAQNMFLAFMPLNPSQSDQIMPSFHRRDLANFVSSRHAGLWNSGVAQRKVLMRPSQVDHPRFTGRSFDPVNGPWDVDNDRDGVPDSVWIDVGLPVQTARDGRKFKPLVAVLCVDLDGRLNLNAHGSTAQVDPDYTTAPSTPPAYFAGGTVPTRRRGQGYGPAEIDLHALFVGTTTYQQFLSARYLDSSGTGSTYTTPPTGSTPYPGVTGNDDSLSGLKQFEYPLTIVGRENEPTAFGTPDDLRGRGFTALDVRGRPLMPYLGAGSHTKDDPYELNLSRRNPRNSNSPRSTTSLPPDAPFSAGELERIMRWFDLDAAALPARLTTLGFDSQFRNVITTDSYGVPAPGILATRDIAKGNIAFVGSQHLVDLLKMRLQQHGLPAANVDAEVKKMLPPELVGGELLDINRPFGNGHDDDGDGVVDEPGENETAFWLDTNVPTDFQSRAPQLSNGIDVDYDGTIDAQDSILARQLYARHLYILMMLLKDTNADIGIDGGGPDTKTETARAIAQWAINVVDFRDRDSIMTAFEYTIDPFKDGWTVDGDLATTGETGRAVVWGCERPELLLTESLAWHARMTEDLKTDNGGFGPDHTTINAMNRDLTFDQRLRPRSGAFFEIYNPWTTNTSNTTSTFVLPMSPPSAAGFPAATEASGEFYSLDTSIKNFATGVQLNRLAPSNSPVWRLLVMKGTALIAGQPKDPDDPIVANRPTAAEIERSVYFAQPSATITGHGYPYFTSLPVAPLLPGRYAVVGSAGQTKFNTGGKYVNLIGRLQTTSEPPGGQDGVSAGVRQIVLYPDAEHNVAKQVEILNNGRTPAEPDDDTAKDIQHPIAIVINQTLDATGTAQDGSLSISEPVAGYIATGWNPLLANGEGAYLSPIDVPLDTSPELTQNGTTASYRFVHLQRLANPLEAWDATTNPYLTIDTMPVALTAFNGATNDPEPGVVAPTALASFQRGDTDTPRDNDLWPREQPITNTTTHASAADATHNFPFVLNWHSLGYLNTNYGDMNSGTAYKQSDCPGGTEGYIGAPKDKTFPWFTWNNRPFVGPMELMLVPRSRSSRLLFDFAAAAPALIYDGTAPDMRNPGNGHLVNFFAKPATPTTDYGRLHRLFDYVQVPSRFVGTETMLSPTAVTPQLPDLTTEQGLFSYFHPPFNKVSNYRVPGLVNINTISDQVVWDAIVKDPSGASTPTWSDIFDSRQGGAVLSSHPSLFGNPFRPYSTAAYQLPDSPGIATRDEVDVSLLRPSLTDPTKPLFDNPSLNLSEDPIRNPYFRYEKLQRLNNMLTTHSNVYAIWITIGYFEVTPVPVDPNKHPDGYRLGQEVGSETGEVKRHRSFYIYDRSIPVGFEPGRDHNIEQGILVRRFIE